MKEDIKKELKDHEAYVKRMDIWRLYEGEDEIIDSKESFVLEKKNQHDFKIKTSFGQLDKIIGGFYPGNLIILSGPTGHGKTTFSQSLTRNFEKQDIATLWFPFEGGRYEFLEKFAKLGDDFPTFYLPKKLKHDGIQWLQDKIEEAIAKYDAKVVFIDHLHYLIKMRDMAVARNTSLLIGDTLRTLKETAQRYDIVIILISHLTKLQYREVPEVDDLRDSSFIGQEADYVMFVVKSKQEENKNALIVSKNRRTGQLGTIQLKHENGFLGEYSVHDQNYEDTQQKDSKSNGEGNGQNPSFKGAGYTTRPPGGSGEEPDDDIKPEELF